MSLFSSEVVERATKVLRGAILNTLDSEPFFAQILMNVGYEPAPIGTCAVDGEKFLFDPRFMAKRTIKDRKFVVAHEALHLALLHPFQLRDAIKAGIKINLELANIAMDYVVNALLKEMGWELPKDALFDKRFTHEMEWYQVYKILEKEMDDSGESDNTSGGDSEGNSDNNFPGRGSQPPTENRDAFSDGSESESNEVSPTDSRGNSSDNSGTQNEDKQTETFPNQCKGHPNGGVIPAKDELETESEIKENLSQALKICKSAGKMGAALQRKLEDVLEVIESPWAILGEHLTRETSGDKTHRRPSRRHIDSEFIFPAIEKDLQIQDGIVAFDTSGSMTQPEMNHSWNNATILFQEYSGNVFLLFCDARLDTENVYEFDCESADDKLPVFSGGGGTRFKPVFDWVEEQGLEPDFLIYFTDGYPCDWDHLIEPNYPVFWMITTRNFDDDDIPFGIPIDISREKW